jgi:deazaflavin-dependent oxidoreductase (nitroreductase family)
MCEAAPSPIIDTERGWAKDHIDEYLSGKTPMFRHGAPVALVTTKGRKSGDWRRTALIGADDGDRVILVASGGGDQYPAWYLNLDAEPRVWVQKDGTEFWTIAHTADATEHAALWPKMVALFPDYEDYQKNTTRDIPVIVLERER